MGVPERRQREREERRGEILDAAEVVFLRKGLAAATMEEIAKQAEVSKGTLYLYFDGKDELYLTLANRALTEMLERLARATFTQDSGLEQLRQLVLAHATFATERSNRYRVAITWLTSEYSVSDGSPKFDEYRGLVARLVRCALEIIEKGQRDGSIRTDIDPRALTTQLWGSTLGILLLRQSEVELNRRIPDPLPLDQLVPGFIDLWVRALGTQPGSEASEPAGSGGKA